MYPIIKVFSVLSRLWPLVLGVAFAWFVFSFWGSPPQARSAIPTLEGRTTGADASRSEALLTKNILKLDNPAPQGPSAGPDPSNWKLLGIISGDRPMVLLSVDGKVKTFKVGEQISGWTLYDVQSNMARFQSGAMDRSLVLFQNNGATPQKKGDKSKFSLSKTAIDPVLSDPSALLQQALFKPNVENSKTVGYRIDNIQDNSILKQIGFQNGDILMRINGDPIDGPGKMMQLYSGLKSAKALNLDVKRGPETVSLIVELN